MRNIQTILLAVVLCVFCSCSDRGEDISGRRYPILFGSTDTRAVANLDTLKNQGFKVYAHFEGNLGCASFEKDVTYNSEKNVWGYEGIQYWIPSTKYWFTAFYPKESSAGTVNVKEEEGNYHSYTIEDFDIRKQEDIMVAQAYREVGEGAYAPTTEGSVVNLNFQHLLACVTIAVKTKIDNVTVESITLENIATTGTFSKAIWTSEGTTYLNKEPKKVLNSGVDEYVDVADGGFLLIPQELNGEQKLIIETSNKDYETTIPVGTWESNKKYTYLLTIEQNNINFDQPAIAEPWDETNATGSVIIK